MMKRVMTFFFALSLALAIISLPSVAGAEETYTQTFQVASAEDFTAALAVINADTSGTGNYLISLTGDFTYFGDRFLRNTTTLDGNNHTISGVNSLVVWPQGNDTATLNVKNVTLVGNNNNDDPGILWLSNGAVINMYDGTVLKDHKGHNYFGGGVTVEGATFNMYGGTIENCGIDGGSVCYGGGVAVYNNGTFNMYGGTIKDCYATTDYNATSWQTPASAGGGVFVCGSTFNMSGGTITGCEATTDGGGVALITSLDARYDNGAWGYFDSRFNMTGGTINGCEAMVGGGVFGGAAYVDYYTICAGKPAAAGQMANPGIFISGGTFSENSAANGGGICLNWIRRPVQISNATISGNEADEGAGIDVLGDLTQANISGCTITGNHAEDGNGGGICLNGNSSSSGTTIRNTTITGNTSTEIGAGVYYDTNSKLTISGANTIQNNTYNGALNNLNVLGNAYPVYVNGSLTGSQIGLSDPELWDSQDDSDIYLTSGYKTNNTSVVPSTVFTSDHTGWHADYSEVNVNEVRLVKDIPTYTLYDLDGTVIVDTETYDPSNPTSFDDHNKDGYKFIGWADEEGNLQPETPSENLGHKEYHAIYVHSISDNGFCHPYGIAVAQSDSIGVIAVSTRVDNYRYVLSTASAFGFIIENNDNHKVQITDAKVTAMRTEGEFGGFYTIVSGIPYANFNTTYTITPYVTIGGRTYTGDDVTVSITNTTKWLGNVPTMTKNHSTAIWEE